MTDPEVAVHLAEYDKIKSEQQSRIQHRDSLTYTTLAAMAATVAGTVQQHSAAVLLLLPPIAVVLGWKYLANDEKISSAGRYLRDQLAPRLTFLSNGTGVFGWETAHRSGVYVRVRGYVQTAVDLVTFCLLPLCGLVVFWVTGPRSVPLLTASIGEALLLGALGWLVALASLPALSRPKPAA